MTFDQLNKRLKGLIFRPFVVAYGMGVDSTAMLVALARRYKAGQKACRPDLILFANTKGEKRETYAYEPIIQEYLRQVGFPEIITVQYKPVRATYDNLEDNCLQNCTLPSLAYGKKKCSLKFKRQPQDSYVSKWEYAQMAWELGMTVIKAIGYDAGPKDAKRAWNMTDDHQYHYWYPLRELGWDRERCIEEIEKEGLPVPMKSSCFYCPSMQKEEVEWLCKHHPDMAVRIIYMERNAEPYNDTVEGLWRSSSKNKPGSMTEYIKKNRLLPLPLINEVEGRPLNTRPNRCRTNEEVEDFDDCSESCF